MSDFEDLFRTHLETLEGLFRADPAFRMLDLIRDADGVLHRSGCCAPGSAHQRMKLEEALQNVTDCLDAALDTRRRPGLRWMLMASRLSGPIRFSVEAGDEYDLTAGTLGSPKASARRVATAAGRIAEISAMVPEQDATVQRYLVIDGKARGWEVPARTPQEAAFLHVALETVSTAPRAPLFPLVQDLFHVGLKVSEEDWLTSETRKAPR